MTPTDPYLDVQLAERQMCEELLALARVYYADPKNQAEYEAWKKQQQQKSKEC